MKSKFKIQAYQTDAVENTTNIFVGQPNRDPSKCRRDLGKRGSGVIPTESAQPYAGEKYGGWRIENTITLLIGIFAAPCIQIFLHNHSEISEKFTKFAFK